MNAKANAMLGGGLALFLVIGFVLTILPQLRSTARAQAEIGGFEAELAEQNTGPETIALLRERLDTLEQIGENRITPIPQEADLAGLMRRMSEMFNADGIDPPQLTTGVPQQDKGAMSMPMTVVAEGSFLPLSEAIASIEALPRLVRVRRVRLATDASRRRQHVDRDEPVRADLLLDVFYEPFDASEEEDK